MFSLQQYHTFAAELHPGVNIRPVSSFFYHMRKETVCRLPWAIRSFIGSAYCGFSVINLYLDLRLSICKQQLSFVLWGSFVHINMRHFCFVFSGSTNFLFSLLVLPLDKLGFILFMMLSFSILISCFPKCYRISKCE